MKRILYIVPHRLGRSPGQRFRCEQYLEILRSEGFSITYSNIISKTDDRYFYSYGHYLRKILIVFKAILIRLFDAIRAHRYDIIFIYREAFMMGTTLFEHLLKWSGKPIVFDFDDAIWLNDISDGNKNLGWLKNPSKTDRIIQYSSLVLAGNAYLAQHAKIFNPHVEIIPTTIDTSYHIKTKTNFNSQKPVCIGWTGTATTLKHFQTALPVLIKLKNKYRDKIFFKIIVDVPFEVPQLNLVATIWEKEKEIEQLEDFQIGIMPLPDDDWSKGKCGFKGLQYMSLEIPTVVSPVGVNTEIVRDGENGFLASGPYEWMEKLSALIDNPELRERIGKNGRNTVLQRYSVISQQNRYIELMKKTAQKTK